MDTFTNVFNYVIQFITSNPSLAFLFTAVLLILELISLIILCMCSLRRKSTNFVFNNSKPTKSVNNQQTTIIREETEAKEI